MNLKAPKIISGIITPKIFANFAVRTKPTYPALTPMEENAKIAPKIKPSLNPVESFFSLKLSEIMEIIFWRDSELNKSEISLIQK